jgi:Tol biopolymer transport system component
MLFTSLVLVACGGGSSGSSASTSATTTPSTVADTATATTTPVTDAPTTTAQPSTTLPATIDLATLPGRIAATSTTCGADVLPPTNPSRWLLVCTLQPDGTGAQTLSNARQNAVFPRFLYDGTHLTFFDLNTSLIIVDLATGQSHRRASGEKISSGNSPDGNWQIVGDDAGLSVTHLTGADAGTTKMVAADPTRNRDISPSWSPDSTRFAYLSPSDGKGATLTCDDVWIGSVEASAPVQVTHTATNTGPEACIDEVHWSPDGTLLLLHTSGGGTNGSANIYTVRPDGTALTALTNTGDATPDPAGNGVIVPVGSTYAPVWSPDGKYIAFTRLDGTAYGLYVMRPDGTGITPIPGPAGLVADINELAWAPA